MFMPDDPWQPVLCLILEGTGKPNYWPAVRKTLKHLLRSWGLRCRSVTEARTMTRFLDGPALGVTLELQRAPLFLRVVRSHDGEWDALDQLFDIPRPGEQVVVYRRQGRASCVHVESVAKGRRRWNWFQMADYRIVAEQPAADVTADMKAWQAWCVAHQKEAT